jgi:hypothetical protein
MYAGIHTQTHTHTYAHILLPRPLHNMYALRMHTTLFIYTP